MKDQHNCRQLASRKSTAVATLLVSWAILLPLSAVQTAKKPLLKHEVIELLKSYVPASRIEEVARQYGLAFELNPETEKQLREAGANDELLKALRELSPPPPPPAPKKEAFSSLLVEAHPGGAQVFLDGKVVGVTSPEGRLELTQLERGTHTVSLALAGYEDFQQTINLVAGQLSRLTASLSATFRVTHKHTMGGCNGLLTIGNGRLGYHADDGKDSIDVPVSEVSDWGEAALGQFFFRVKDGRRYFFRSKSKRPALEAMQQAFGKR